LENKTCSKPPISHEVFIWLNHDLLNPCWWPLPLKKHYQACPLARICSENSWSISTCTIKSLSSLSLWSIDQYIVIIFFNKHHYLRAS
jgi:hypothetical protein